MGVGEGHIPDVVFGSGGRRRVAGHLILHKGIGDMSAVLIVHLDMVEAGCPLIFLRQGDGFARVLTVCVKVYGDFLRPDAVTVAAVAPHLGDGQVEGHDAHLGVLGGGHLRGSFGSTLLGRPEVVVGVVVVGRVVLRVVEEGLIRGGLHVDGHGQGFACLKDKGSAAVFIGGGRLTDIHRNCRHIGQIFRGGGGPQCRVVQVLIPERRQIKVRCGGIVHHGIRTHPPQLGHIDGAEDALPLAVAGIRILFRGHITLDLVQDDDAGDLLGGILLVRDGQEVGIQAAFVDGRLAVQAAAPQTGAGDADVLAQAGDLHEVDLTRVGKVCPGVHKGGVVPLTVKICHQTGVHAQIGQGLSVVARMGIVRLARQAGHVADPAVVALKGDHIAEVAQVDGFLIVALQGIISGKGHSLGVSIAADRIAGVIGKIGLDDHQLPAAALVVFDHICVFEGISPGEGDGGEIGGHAQGQQIVPCAARDIGDGSLLDGLVVLALGGDVRLFRHRRPGLEHHAPVGLIYFDKAETLGLRCAHTIHVAMEIGSGKVIGVLPLVPVRRIGLHCGIVKQLEQHAVGRTVSPTE